LLQITHASLHDGAEGRVGENEVELVCVGDHGF
jgi:hypothetical protein